MPKPSTSSLPSYPSYSLNNSIVTLGSRKVTFSLSWEIWLFQTIGELATPFTVAYHRNLKEQPARIAFDSTAFKEPTELAIEVALAISEDVRETDYFQSLPLISSKNQNYKEI